MVAVTCHANAFLRGLPIPEFFPGNSTCKYCDRVRFFSVSKRFFGRVRESEVATSPDEWFEQLKAAEIPEVGLCYSHDDHQGISSLNSATLPGGRGTWSIKVTDLKGQTELWKTKWEIWDQQAPEGRIWRVGYDRFPERQYHSAPLVDLDGAVARFRSALQDICTFSDKHDCAGFTIFFARAVEALDSRRARLHGIHRDLAPDGCLPPLARRLLDACQSAWIFDGLSSWTSLSFDGPTRLEYERVSEGLIAGLKEAIYAGANSSCTSRTNYASEAH